jgi:hypothetical protein
MVSPNDHALVQWMNTRWAVLFAVGLVTMGVPLALAPPFRELGPHEVFVIVSFITGFAMVVIAARTMPLFPGRR